MELAGLGKGSVCVTSRSKQLCSAGHSPGVKQSTSTKPAAAVTVTAGTGTNIDHKLSLLDISKDR